MKALSIQQPWASITAAGIKDVENRTRRPKENPGKILIHTGTKRQNDDFYGELSMSKLFPVENLMFRGYLPDFKEMPSNCIVGTVEIKDITKDSDSIWADPESEWKYELTNGRLFKEPIKGVIGKPNIFNVENIDENNLPETIEIKPIIRDGDILVVPVKEGFIPENHSDLSGEDFGQRILPDNRHLYATEDGSLLPTAKIRFVSGDKTAEYDVAKMYVNIMQDEKGEPVKDGDVYAETIVYILG